MTHHDNYRDQLVQIIKDIGQEIIDRAESMVDKNVDMITNFNINVDIPNPIDAAPTLTWGTTALVKSFVKRECGYSGTADIDMRMETVELTGKDGMKE